MPRHAGAAALDSWEIGEYGASCQTVCQTRGGVCNQAAQATWVPPSAMTVNNMNNLISKYGFIFL